MGERVPLENLPPEVRAGIRPGTPAFATYAADAEKSLGLPAGALTGAKFTWAAGTDPWAAFQAVGADLAKNPAPRTGAAAIPTEAEAAGKDYRPPAAPAPSLDPTDSVGPLENFAAGVGKSFVDTGRGVGQLMGLVSQADIDEAARLDAPLLNNGAGFAGNVTGAVAQTLAPAGILSKGSELVRAAPSIMKAAPTVLKAVTSPVGQGAVIGGGFGAAQPVISGEDRATNAAESAAAGGLGSVLPAAAVKLGTAAKEFTSPAIKKLAETAERAGIPLRASQISDSVLGRWAAGLSDMLPFGGAKDLTEAQRKGYNRALARSMGADTDDALGALQEARPRLDGTYNALKAKYPLQLEPWHVDAMQDINKFFGPLDLKATKPQLGELKALQAAIVNSTDANGQMPGEVHKALYSKIGKMANTAEDTDFKAALKGYQSILDKAFKSGMNKADSAKWELTDRQWANMKDLEKIAPKAPGDDFDLTRLSTVLSSNARSNASRKAAMVYGRGDAELPDLAKIGVQFLGRGKPASPAGASDSLVRLGKAAVAPATAAGAGYGLYQYSKEGEHPFLTTAAGLGAGALGAKALGSTLNSRWFAQGSPKLRLLGQGAARVQQTPAGALNALRSQLEPEEPTR